MGGLGRLKLRPEPKLVGTSQRRGVSMAESLTDLYLEIADCRRCALGATRTQLVFGVGNPNAAIMFIGEAPGQQEDIKGEPFVGAAGKLLDEMLAKIALHRSDVYIANVLKCRPPNNRDPLPEEIEACRPNLQQQIDIIRPRFVCTLGRFAAAFVLGRNVSISREHGCLVSLAEVDVFPLYHPAAALYTGATRKVLEEDFLRLGELLRRPRRRPASPAPLAQVGAASEGQPAEEPAQQDSLW